MSGSESFLYDKLNIMEFKLLLLDEYIWKEKRKYKKRNYEAFLELIDYLKHNVGKHKIIVRPQV